MSLTQKKFSKKLMAGAAAAMLSMSVVACAEVEDTLSEAGDALDDAGVGDGGDGRNGAEPIPEGTNDAEATEETETMETTDEDDAAADTTEVESVDGETLTIPAAAAAAGEEADFGAPESVDEGPDGQTLVTYADGNHIIYSEETGAQPLVGMIAETWVEEGGFDASVGLPTSPERESDDRAGWTQEFTNGTISWVADDAGEFEADIQEN